MAVLEFHPLAIPEARVGRRWYDRISPALATRFMTALDAAVAAVEANPGCGSPYLHGTRVVRLKRFQYLELSPDRLLAVAVAHAHRRPGYWRKRVS
jgi:hypothetical protein